MFVIHFSLDKLNKHVCELNVTQGYEFMVILVWSCECLRHCGVSEMFMLMDRCVGDVVYSC